MRRHRQNIPIHMAFKAVSNSGEHFVAVEYCPESFSERLARADAQVVARIFFGKNSRIEGRGCGLRELPVEAVSGEAAGMTRVWIWPAAPAKTLANAYKEGPEHATA